MNYIKKLEQDNARLQKELFEERMRINDFRSHLRIEKFRQDTTIQVSDVQNRLDLIINGYE